MLAALIIPASATTTTSSRLWGLHEVVDHRDHGGGLGLVALEGPGPQGEPGLVGEQPHGDLRLQASFLGEARLAEAVGLVGLEVQGRHVEQDQRGPADTGASGQRTRQAPGEVLGGVAGQMTLDRGVGHRGHARLGQDPQRACQCFCVSGFGQRWGLIRSG